MPNSLIKIGPIPTRKECGSPRKVRHWSTVERMVLEGYTNREISEAIGMKSATVYLWTRELRASLAPRSSRERDRRIAVYAYYGVSRQALRAMFTIGLDEIDSIIKENSVE